MQRSDGGRGRAGHRDAGQPQSGRSPATSNGEMGTTDTRQRGGSGHWQPPPGKQTSSRSPGRGHSRAGGRSTRTRRFPGSVVALRGISLLFGLLGSVSLYAGIELLVLSTEAPAGASRLQMVGLIAVAVGVAYVYAAYGLWRFHGRGWQVGMGLVGLGVSGTLVALFSSGGAGALIGLAVNCVLGWVLYANRDQFRDQHRTGSDTATGPVETTEQTQRRADGAAGGYASERRGRH
jgi:hypothetical protein